MTLSKTTITTYEIKFYPDAWDVTYGELKRMRKSRNQSIKQFSKCFVCDHSFGDDEIPVFVTVSNLGNRFACNLCERSR